MSKDTDKNLFIVSSMPRLYQQLFTGIANYETLGNRIIRQIKTAHAFRQVEQVRELSRLLANIPIKEYQLIAQYYLLWCKCREYEYPAETLERIIEQTQTYKSQVLSSRAAFEGFRGQLETAMHFYIEALKAAHTVSDHIGATLGVAMIKGIEGFHESALKDMEYILPLIRYSESGLYFNFQNSYATELAATGRTSEARNLSRIVMASPFAPFYPEWQETADDLKEPNRSFISIKHGESEQEITQTNSIQAPLSLDKADDNVLEFPHLVDVEKLEKESEERFHAEMDRFYALTDNCQLHDFVDDVLMGNINPARFAKFLLKMSKFEDIKTVLDVFHFMLRYTFHNSDEFKESETEWTERLLQEIESTDTL